MSEHVPRRACALLYLASHTPQAEAGEALRLLHAVKAAFRLELEAMRRAQRPPGEHAGPSMCDRSVSSAAALLGQPDDSWRVLASSNGGEATPSRTTRPRRRA